MLFHTNEPENISINSLSLRKLIEETIICNKKTNHFNPLSICLSEMFSLKVYLYVIFMLYLSVIISIYNKIVTSLCLYLGDNGGKMYEVPIETKILFKKCLSDCMVDRVSRKN